MAPERYLIVTADDYGIGPETSRGVLDLALAQSDRDRAAGEFSLRRSSGTRMDARRPTDGTRLASLLDAGSADLTHKSGANVGRFRRAFLESRSLHPAFALRAHLGRGNRGRAPRQYHRFRELTGQFPSVVNTHHHVQVFPPVGRALYQLFDRYFPLPYLRRVRESWATLANVPGARAKRLFLTTLGRRDARRQDLAGFAGNDWLAGVTDPPFVRDPSFMSRWIANTPGEVIELTCHPGHFDKTLIGRDCTPEDGQLERRPRELELLQSPSFDEACRNARLVLTSPREWLKGRPRRSAA